MEDEAAIGIELAEITGVEEPVGAQRFRRLLRNIQITGGGLPPDQDEPDLSSRQIAARCRIDDPPLHPGQRGAARLQPPSQRVVGPTDRVVAAGFVDPTAWNRALVA